MTLTDETEKGLITIYRALDKGKKEDALKYILDLENGCKWPIIMRRLWWVPWICSFASVIMIFLN